MSRRHRNRGDRNGLNWGNENYWATADYNRRVFTMYRQQIFEIAMSRFKWVNLPDSCDARFLEWILLNQGVATIAFPRKQPGFFYSTQMTYNAPLNVYDNPTSWRSMGNNGWQFSVTPRNGVVVWDNEFRVPILDWIDIYARELTDLTRTGQLNRMHQKIPYILKGPQEKKLDMTNLYKQIAGGEPAILATNGIEAIDVSVLSTEVPWLGAEIYAAKENLWNEIFMALGVPNLPFKQERQIEDEVRSQTAPHSLAALNPLDARRAACDKLNTNFEQYLEHPVQVVWNEDLLSKNYNYFNNIPQRMTDERKSHDGTL